MRGGGGHGGGRQESDNLDNLGGLAGSPGAGQEHAQLSVGSAGGRDMGISWQEHGRNMAMS